MENASLTSALAPCFAPEVRAEGEKYFQEKRVTKVKGGGYYVQATVAGESADYHVSCGVTHPHRQFLKCRCECPFSAEQVCKHVWATLLEADRQGYMRGFADAPPKVAIPESKFADAAANPEDYLDPDKPGSKSRPRQLTWQDQLGRVEKGTQYDYGATMAEENRDGWGTRKEVAFLIEGAMQRGNALTLQLMNRERKLDGEWGKPRNGAPRRGDIPNLPEVDRAILYSLYGGADHSFGGSYYSDSSVHLSMDHARQILPAIADTGRFYFRPAAGAEMVPLSYEPGNPWKFTLHAAREGEKGPWTIGAELVRGNEHAPLERFALLIPAGFAVAEGLLHEVDYQGAFAWAKHFREEPTLTVPFKEFPDFLEKAYSKRVPAPLPPPRESGIVLREEPMRPVLKVRQPEANRRAKPGELWARLDFRYGDRVIEADENRNALFDRAAGTILRRDVEAERKATDRLKALGFKDRYYHGSDLVIRASKLPDIVRTLIGEGWHVEAEGKIYRTAGAFKLKVSSGIDWFELKGTVDFDGKAVPLPSILEAVRNQQAMVDLGDGEIGMLPEEWLKKYALLAGIGEGKKDHVRFGRNQAGLLDALLTAQPDVDVDEKFRTAREKFRSFKGVAAAKPPKGFTGELRPYQAEGLGWLKFLREFGFGGCLADDMGLGKTVQVLAMLAERAGNRPKDAPRASLVVVPKSLVFNWKAEAERFAPKLLVLDHTGPEREKDTAFIAGHDIVLTTYGILRNDFVYLKDIPFDYGILDESTAIKNAGSESAKACRLINAKNRLAMSGTPIENHLGELWSLFEYLNPGMLGRATAFQRIGGMGRGADVDSREILTRALRPYILRRTKDQVARDLPEKTEQTVFCELEPKQRKAYDELKEFYRQSLLGKVEQEGMGKSKIMILEALLRLRQVACHPGLIDKAKDGEASAKLDALLPQLHEVHEEGHKALVFSQFTSFLDIVKKRLNAEAVPYLYLDGQTSAKQRQAMVEKFQTDPNCGLFLISLKAGGVGLNLTAAEYVFLLDPWWNPAIEAQAVDRAHRIGQTKAVFAYRYIAKDTVEEKVLALQQSKKALADSIINADNSLIKGLKQEDLELLLS